MSERIRLLLCEDSDDDAALIARHLERGGLAVEHERVQTASAMERVLREHPPDLIVSDYNIPGFGAEEALALVRESGLDVPFILMSGRIGEESAASLMRAGAHDFVLKDRMARLVPAVRRELRQAESRRERRAAREALRRTEQRFRRFVENAPDVIFRFRAHPVPEVEFISPAAVTVLGRRPEELCGDPAVLFSLVAPEDRAGLEASWRSSDPEPLVVRWLRPDGAEAWTEQRAVALRDETGRVTAVEGILRDVTDRVHADAERDRLQQQLRQAERLESLGRLAGGVAHDFNNLLSVILGHADLLLADLPRDSPYRAGVDIVRRLAERGGTLTRRLLLFSRQESLEPVTLNVNEVVRETEEVLRGAIEEDIDFRTRLDPALRPVTIDRGELERLLLNLVANSRKAMPHGGRLTVETRGVGRGAADGTVRILVTDTGNGMSQEVARRAFEPFFTTAAGTGTGLGLSMAYGVVKGAGGEIALESVPGEGTTVRIDLPAAEGEADAERAAQRAPEGGAGQTVLVVEDDDGVRAMARMMLVRSGYEVVEAGSPDAALAALSEPGVRIDALLSDVVMPGMSGTELTARIRSRLPTLPVVLMSGHTAGALPHGEPLPSATVLIRKPFATATLLRALSDVLGARAGE